MFSTASKPKVLTNQKFYGQGDLVEFMIVDELKPELLVEKPDLVAINKDTIIDPRFYERFKVVKSDARLSEEYLHKISVDENLARNHYEELISIFTPTYNIGDKIYRAYESLLNQSYSNWEWVIVDDSTHEETLEYLRKIESVDPRVHVYSFDRKTRGNIGESKYRAAKLCNGVVYVEFDHDDYLTHDCLELIMRAYHEHPNCGFYYSDCTEYNFDNGESQNYGEPGFGLGYCRHYPASYNGWNFLATNGPALTAKSLRHIVGVPNHVRAWRADIYNLIGGHNRFMRIADDYELIIRTFLRTKWCYIPKLLYIQCWGGNSQDSGDNRRDIQFRVHEIANYYSDQITQRLKELGTEDPFAGKDSSEAIYDESGTIYPELQEVLSI